MTNRPASRLAVPALAILLLWPAMVYGGAVPTSKVTWQSEKAEGDSGPCLDLGDEDSLVAEALRDLTFKQGDQARPLTQIRLLGLKTVREDKLWDLLGGRPESKAPAGSPPARLGADTAATTILLLSRTGLFAKVTPAVRIDGPDSGAILEVTLVENPTLTKVVIDGLEENQGESLVEALLDLPSDEEDDEDHAGCPFPFPPRDWLAWADEQVVHAGIVWGGMHAAIQRVTGKLFNGGYHMASLSADLAGDGTLTLHIDEGRIQSVTVHGVHPRIESQVMEALGLPRGRVFLAADVEAAMQRVKDAVPFLDEDPEERTTDSEPEVDEEADPAGALHYHLVEMTVEKNTSFTVDGKQVTIYLKAKTFVAKFDALDLLRHTPASGFAPGMNGSARFWDRGDRAHVALDLAGNVNTHRVGMDERHRFDWLVGPRVQIPLLRIAEVGFRFYSLTDTFDRWRMSDIDSYIYSLLLNRADSDYFRRSGFTGLVTAHLAERVTFGAEYRLDRYDSLSPIRHLYTFFHRSNEGGRVPMVDQGRMGSVVLRLELSTFPVPAHRVGRVRRDLEQSIVDNLSGGHGPRFRTVNTFEIARPSLGSDDGFSFNHLVSDSASYLPVTQKSTVIFRFRAAGSAGGDRLPLQKREALGGWTALRGYDFKEFGDGWFSVLGTAEYEHRWLSVFVDLGTVARYDGLGWTPARVGLGASFGRTLVVAWRTDDRESLAPSFRVLINENF